LLFVQLTEKRQALLALSFVSMLCEFEDVHFAEFPAGFQVGRAAQNCQLFFGQSVVTFLAWH
jgi:hypothetical protein